jgi:hypothetical protein
MSEEKKIEDLISEAEKILTPPIKEYFLTEGCKNIFKHVNSIKILHKTSASNSIILFGILEYEDIKENIVLKIVFEPKNVLNNSLKVEEQIYKNNISYLLDNFHTPHLIKYIATIPECKLDFSKYKFAASEYDDFEDMLDTLDDFKDEYNINNSTITILTKTTGKTLYEEFPLLSENEKFIIIFQILYTLLCFNNITLIHNDLHLSNIFVETSDTIYNYKINDKIISIESKFVAKIYDFDRSTIYSPSVERNFEIDIEYCEDFGQCSGIDIEKDLQSFIASLISYSEIFKLSENIKNWINQITTESFRNEVKKREHVHITKYKVDLLPLKTCLKTLLQFMNRNNIYKEGAETKLIYTLPEEKKIIDWYPFSNKTNIFTRIDDSGGKSIETINGMYDLIEINNLYQIYKEEFKKLGYNIRNTSIELFKQFNNKKLLISHNNISNYLYHCILLSLPFWYKIQNVKIKIALSKKLGIIYKPEIEENIWNIFSNRLLVKVPLI